MQNVSTKWVSMMNKKKQVVQTILGTMDSDLIGYCQCHEHLFIEKGKSFEVNSTLHMDDINKSIAELRLYKNCGGNTLVDAQPVGCGRMAENLIKSSQESNVHVIATTGFHKFIFYRDSHWIFKMDVDELSKLFIKEIKECMVADGNNKTPVTEIKCKAGIIKAAIEPCGITGEYVKFYEAVANAAAQTGAPVMIHTEKGADVIKAIRFFEDRKVSASSIILCHLDRTNENLEVHKEIAKMGAFLEYDTIGRFKYHSDEKEITFLSALIAAGYENQILLGFDSTNERLKSYGGNVGLDYILTTFLPNLKRHGICDETIKKITTSNPKMALSMKY